MRGDLRASIESVMANQAFALSPISARASLPSEEDYDAIREAFMETARGRWFLDEYARRNRNADTSMVLDAVSRIEETLAQQRQSPPPEDMRPELLAIFRSAVAEAEQTASAALDRLGLEESLAPIRKGARIIREISWRWREIGADGRICDLLDSQVGAIESGCETIAVADPRAALRDAFDAIKASISAFSDIAGAPPAAAEAVVEVPPPAADNVTPAAEEFEIAPEAIIAAPEVPADPVEALAGEAEPYDEAMLERVALEMAAPDFDDADPEFATSVPEEDVAELRPAEFIEPPQVQMAEPPHESAPEPVVVKEEPAVAAPPVAPEAAPSLGATILANGLVTRPKIPANDPLAPIRRMTQAEKIAFFS
jgi:hypothetical protein